MKKNLLNINAWHMPDPGQWMFSANELACTTQIFDGELDDPRATAFLISNETFGGDILFSVDINFEVGRYIGVYLDFDQKSQSGIWMATGHALSGDAPDNEVERGYIKTVDNDCWIIRTTGELVVKKGEMLRLGFANKNDDYSLWNDGKLVITYHKPGGYPAGPLQLRLMNAKARIHRLEVQSD